MRTRWFQNIGFGKNTSPSALPAAAAENPEGMSSRGGNFDDAELDAEGAGRLQGSAAVGQRVRRARQRRDARNSRGKPLFSGAAPACRWSTAKLPWPVTLPPGCAKLAARPAAIGSDREPPTMGIVELAACAICATFVPPSTTMTFDGQPDQFASNHG